MGLPELLKAVSALTPFAYGFAVYKFFHYLDRRASAKAKDAVRAWIKPRNVNHVQVSAAILELFDKLYGAPLLSARGFFRSARFTLIVSALSISAIIVIYEDVLFSNEEELETISFRWYLAGIAIGISLFSNVLSDYFSLFFVRRSLTVSTTHPLRSSFVSALIGICIVLAIYYGRILFFEKFLNGGTVLEILNTVFGFENLSGRIGLSMFGSEYQLIVTGLSDALFVPAILVHLWLPLLAAGVILSKSLNWFSAAVTKMQWFIKQGRNHPLDAVGYVAGVIAFILTALLQVLLRWFGG